MAKFTQKEIENLYKPIAIKDIIIAIKATSFLPKKHHTHMVLCEFYRTVKNNHSLI